MGRTGVSRFLHEHVHLPRIASPSTAGLQMSLARFIAASTLAIHFVGDIQKLYSAVLQPGPSFTLGTHNTVFAGAWLVGWCLLSFWFFHLKIEYN